jgi:hypothetical protein
MLQEHRDEEQIHQIGWQVAAACGIRGMLLYAGARRDAGDSSAYEDLVNRSTDPVTLALVAEELQRRGDQNAAASFVLRAAAAGEVAAWGVLVDLRLAAGDLTGAEPFARQAATLGDTAPLVVLAEAHENAGNLAEAELLAQEAVAAGDPDAWLWPSSG